MFQDTLLESSSTAPARKRWPMATAFLLETLLAGILVAVPLLSTGIIPASAHDHISAPLQSIEIAGRPANSHPSRGNPGGHSTTAEVVTINNAHTLHIGAPRQIAVNNPCPLCPVEPDRFDIGGLPKDLADSGSSLPPSVASPKRPLHVSELSQAMLEHKVEPVYPRIAWLSGISGVVKLHAIIGRDGSVQSLSLISGHPILAAAALEAVAQWRYRPYLLNGEPVEVETFITVNFRKAGR
jgi:protein TonB